MRHHNRAARNLRVHRKDFKELSRYWRHILLKQEDGLYTRFRVELTMGWNPDLVVETMIDNCDAIFGPEKHS